jgi:hypothetical protein
VNHPLETLDWRLERADKHLTALDKKRDAFLARINKKDRRVIGQFDRDTSEYVFRINGKPPNPRIGLIVGEFAHHLRATLDNLVWQLVLLRGGCPTVKTQFPIYETWERYLSSLWMLRGVSADDRAAIELCQPFQVGERAPDSYLALLAWLNNVDKHRLLHVGGALPERFNIRVSFGDESPDVGDFPWYATPLRDIGKIGRPTYVPTMATNDRTELMRVPVEATGPDPQMQMKGDEPIEVSLSDPKHALLLDDLRNIHKVVASIVEGFRPRFNI